MKSDVQDTRVIKRRFERDASNFDAIYNTKTSEFSTWFNRTFRKPVFERYHITFEAMGDLQGKTLLDVGCGSGVYDIQAAKMGAKFIKGIDFSEPMLAIARRRAIDNNVSKQCEFQLADFLDLNQDEHYNFVFAMGVFDYLIDPKPFLHKMKTVATERVIASFPGHSLIREPLRKLRYFLTSKGSVHFYSYRDVCQLAETVNFKKFEVRSMKTGSGFMLIGDL